MEQAVNILVLAGKGSLMLFFLFVGAVGVWHIHKANPRLSRRIAWALMIFGILLCSFTLYGGTYFAILGSILLSLCDTGGKIFRKGLPENVNPFSVIADVCICDGVLSSEFPVYFRSDGNFDPDQSGSCRTCFALADVLTPRFSQDEIESLVRRIHASEPVGIVAVKEQYAHIIPENLKKSVRVTQSAGGRTLRTETYYLET